MHGVDEAACLGVAVRLAAAAGEIIADAFDANEARGAFELKAANDHVTATGTDLASERLILDGLRTAFPGHRLVGEESTGVALVALGTGPTWLVDPLDGTTNFVHGYPHCAVSLGLCVGGEPVVAVVHDPFRRETFTATRGGGAQIGQRRRLAVSGRTELAGAMASVEWPASDRIDALQNQFDTVGAALGGRNLSALRSGGSCVLDLAWDAAGRLDLSYRAAVTPASSGPQGWDVCAGALLGLEAGGTLTGTDGGPFDLMSGQFIATGTAELATEFRSCTGSLRADDSARSDRIPGARL
eukprot:SAG22_NODE_183_length_16031_cov_36.647000_17_plen_299_part_00